MFYYLKGRAAHLAPNLAVIDCGGVGYACRTTSYTLSGLQMGQEVTLYTHLNVREDAMELYGFGTEKERNCFQLLIGVSGVGPKAALSILSATTPEGLATAIITGDEKALTVAQGIGKKIAQRILLELKDKLGMAIIMITHDLGIVASMCDRIAVMYAGRIVETGTCDEIFYHPKHEYTKGLLESIPRLDSTKHEKLIPIEGNPVDLLNPPEGCEFAPRCKNCMKICLRENPPRTDFSETHYAHCFMNQKAEMEGGNTNE